MARKFSIQPFTSEESAGSDVSAESKSTSLTLKGNQGFSEQLLQFLGNMDDVTGQEDAEIVFASEHEAKIYLGKTVFDLHFSSVNPTEVYRVEHDELYFTNEVNGHLSVMNTTENFSLVHKTTGVKRPPSSVVVQQEEIDVATTVTTTVLTSPSQLLQQPQGPVKKKVKADITAAKPIQRGVSIPSNKPRIQAMSTMVRLMLPLEITRAQVSSFFQQLKVQNIFASIASIEATSYAVYVKFETMSGAELALMEQIKVTTIAGRPSEVLVETVNKLEAILVCGMCFKMKSNDCSGRALQKVLLDETMAPFRPLFCVDLRSYEGLLEQYNRVNLYSDPMGIDQFAELLQSFFDLKYVGVNDWIAQQILQPDLFSYHPMAGSTETKAILEDISKKLIQLWSCRATLGKSKTNELRDFELTECVTQSILLHEALFALFWRVMINDKLPDL